MIKAIWNYFFPPEPSINCIPDMTGLQLDMQYLINSMGENKEWPRVGDLVIKIDSGNMGTYVRRDTRYRVRELRTPYETSWIGELLTGEAMGKRVIEHIFYLRKHTTIPRVWILCD